MSWTPPSDSEAGDWTSSLQILVDEAWRDFDYDHDQIVEGTRLTFSASFVRVPTKYTDRVWRLIIVDENHFSETNTETIDEPGDMSLVEDTPGQATWSYEFQISANVAAVASEMIRVGMVDQKARERKERDQKRQKSPLGISAPRPCEVG
jgi:hypothetical protein